MIPKSLKIRYTSPMLLSLRSSFDVITVGAATQDIFLRSPHLEETPNADAPDGLNVCIPFGAKINIEEMHITSGGGATNAAVTFARYGLKTACLCRIGNDQIGANIIDELRREKVSSRFVQKDRAHKTACSVILLSGGGHRAILTHRGASSHLSSTQIPWSSLRTRWIYLTSVAGDLDLVKQVFKFARTQKINIAWNPGQAELNHGLRKLSPLFKQTKILLLNREESALVSELPARHLRAIFQKLGRLPETATIITDGQKGAYAYHKDKKVYLFAPILSADRINSTGAGDAFGSGCISAFIKGTKLDEALQVGTLNATGVISHMGAKTGILHHLPTERERKIVHIKQLSPSAL